MNQLETFATIDTFIFDVDGVLTNSQVLVTEDGNLLRHMSIRDGYAIKLAVNKGYKVCIITGGRSEGVKKRLEGLGVKDIYIGISDKMSVFEEYIETNELDTDHVLYMGDDMPDYLVMTKVGLPTCPANAAPELFSIAKYVSPKDGGEGCARDVIEKVLKLNGDWVIE